MKINNIIKKTLNFQKFYHKLKYKEAFKCLAQTQKFKTPLKNKNKHLNQT